MRYVISTCTEHDGLRSHTADLAFRILSVQISVGPIGHDTLLTNPYNFTKCDYPLTSFNIKYCGKKD
jgi:hypothetical protein